MQDREHSPTRPLQNRSRLQATTSHPGNTSGSFGRAVRNAQCLVQDDPRRKTFARAEEVRQQLGAKIGEA